MLAVQHWRTGMVAVLGLQERVAGPVGVGRLLTEGWAVFECMLAVMAVKHNQFEKVYMARSVVHQHHCCMAL